VRMIFLFFAKSMSQPPPSRSVSPGAQDPAELVESQPIQSTIGTTGNSYKRPVSHINFCWAVVVSGGGAGAFVLALPVCKGRELLAGPDAFCWFVFLSATTDK
jgi:hypothetical protein